MFVLIWNVALWGPRNSQLSKQRTRLDTANGEVQKLRTQLTRLQAAQRAEPVKRAKLERLRTAIPDDPGLGQFILDANDAANRAGINFVSIAPSPPAPASSPGGATQTAGAGAAAGGAGARPAEVKLSMTISGGYSQVLDFINRLDALPRIVVIDGLNVAASGGTGGAPSGAGGTAATPAPAGPIQLNVSLTGRMFLTQVPAAFATGGSGGGATTPTTTAGGTTSTTTSGSTTTTPR